MDEVDELITSIFPKKVLHLKRIVKKKKQVIFYQYSYSNNFILYIDEELEDIFVKEEDHDQITYKDEKIKNRSLNMKNPINREFKNEKEIEPTLKKLKKNESIDQNQPKLTQFFKKETK